MNTNNTAVVTNAVSLVNQANQSRVEAQAAELVKSILERQTANVAVNARIVSHREALAEIAGDTINPSTIGVVLPTDESTDTASQKTVRNVIATLNKAKQDDIQYKSGNIVRAITNEQATLVVMDKQIADLQVKLLALSAETVTEAQVTPAAN